MSGSDLAALVCSYVDDDEVTLLPEDPERETRLNTWSYGVPDGPIDVAAVVAALQRVHRELEATVGNHSRSRHLLRLVRRAGRPAPVLVDLCTLASASLRGTVPRDSRCCGGHRPGHR